MDIIFKKKTFMVIRAINMGPVFFTNIKCTFLLTLGTMLYSKFLELTHLTQLKRFAC